METPTEEVRLVRKKELAGMLSISPRTIDTWLAKRVIPYVAVSARLHLFDPAAVRKVITDRFGVVPR